MGGRLEVLVVWVMGTLAVNYAQMAAPDFDLLPGIPGVDYPIYAEIPETSFSCANQPFLGYYADMSTGCQVYHLCEEGGKKSSFLCPNGTVFNQLTQKCDEWYHVDCSLAPQLFWRNKYFAGKPVGVDVVAGKTQETNESSDSTGNSDDTDEKLEKLRRSLSKSSLAQFKESLNKLISERVQKMKGSMKVDNIGNHEMKIQEEEKKKKESQKQNKTAEKIFLLLDYIDKIKSALAEPKFTNDPSVMGNTKYKLFPSVGEKLFKILMTLEKKQNSSSNAGGNGKSSPNLNIVKDIDFFNNYKYYATTEKNNQDHNELSPDYLMQGTPNLISDTTAIEMIHRILDIAKKTVIPTSHENADKTQSSPNNEESLEQKSQDNASLVDTQNRSEQFNESTTYIANHFESNSDNKSKTGEGEIEINKDAINNLSDEFKSKEKNVSDINLNKDVFNEELTETAVTPENSSKDAISEEMTTTTEVPVKNVFSIENSTGIPEIVNGFSGKSSSESSSIANTLVTEIVDEKFKGDTIMKENDTKIDDFSGNLSSTDSTNVKSEANISRIDDVPDNVRSGYSKIDKSEVNVTKIEGLAENASSTDKSVENGEMNFTSIDGLADNSKRGEQREFISTKLDGSSDSVSGIDKIYVNSEVNTPMVNGLVDNVSISPTYSSQGNSETNGTDIDGISDNVMSAISSILRSEVNLTGIDTFGEIVNSTDRGNEEGEVNATLIDDSEKLSGEDRNNTLANSLNTTGVNLNQTNNDTANVSNTDRNLEAFRDNLSSVLNSGIDDVSVYEPKTNNVSDNNVNNTKDAIIYQIYDFDTTLNKTLGGSGNSSLDKSSVLFIPGVGEPVEKTEGEDNTLLKHDDDDDDYSDELMDILKDLYDTKE